MRKKAASIHITGVHVNVTGDVRGIGKPHPNHALIGVHTDQSDQSGIKSMTNPIIKWLGSTSNRSFIIYPILIPALTWARHGLTPPSLPWATLPDATWTITPWWAALMVWGYLQFKWTGRYRSRLGGGGPGIAIPPDRILNTGLYRFTRNPMYLGHLIFMTGLALTFHSIAGFALLVFHVVWFQRRVKGDELSLEKRFGNPYREYKDRVKRWIPFVI